MTTRLKFIGLLALLAIAGMILTACGGSASGEEQHSAQVDIPKPTPGPKTYSSQVYCSGLLVTMSTQASAAAPVIGMCAEGVVTFSTSSQNISLVISEKSKVTKVITASGMVCTEDKGAYTCTSSEGPFVITTEKPKVKDLKVTNTGTMYQLNCAKEIPDDICLIAPIEPSNGLRLLGRYDSATDASWWVGYDWVLPGNAMYTWFHNDIPVYALKVAPFTCYGGTVLEWKTGANLTYDYNTSPCK